MKKCHDFMTWLKLSLNTHLICFIGFTWYKTDFLMIHLVFFADNVKKEISTSASLPNETSFLSDTVRQSGAGYMEEGRIEASLNYRLLHGHLKWRPEILTDLTVSWVLTCYSVKI